jgi:four helix bundle protein
MIDKSNVIDKENLKNRTREFAIRIIKLCRALPGNREGRLIGNQLFRCATSVGANYRAACRARSKAEFASKLGIVEEECDETLYWLEMIKSLNIVKPKRLELIIQEANEILAITVASIKTAKRK